MFLNTPWTVIIVIMTGMTILKAQSDCWPSGLSFALETRAWIPRAASLWSLSSHHALGDTGPGTSFFLPTCAPSKAQLTASLDLKLLGRTCDMPGVVLDVSLSSPGEQEKVESQVSMWQLGQALAGSRDVWARQADLVCSPAPRAHQCGEAQGWGWYNQRS